MTTTKKTTLMSMKDRVSEELLGQEEKKLQQLFMPTSSSAPQVVTTTPTTNALQQLKPSGQQQPQDQSQRQRQRQQQQHQQQQLALLTKNQKNSIGQQQQPQRTPLSWSPLEIRKDYFPQKWLFWSPIGILTGLSSYWLKVSPVAIIIRQLLLYSGILLAWVVAMYLVPDFNHTCCYGPRIKFHNRGDCDDKDSVISREPHGQLHVHCGSYPVSLHIWILVTCSVFALAVSLLYGYEWEHVKRSYKRRVEHVKGLITLGENETIEQEDLESAVMLAVNSASTVSPTGHFWAAFFPDFYGFGIFLRAFTIRWLTKFLLLFHTATAIFIMIIVFEEDMYQAWWRCYPSGTSLSHLTHGVCTTTLYPRSPVWGMWIIIAISIQGVALVMYLASVYDEYLDQAHPDRIIARKQTMSTTIRDTLNTFIVSYRNSMLPKPQDLRLLTKPPAISAITTSVGGKQQPLPLTAKPQKKQQQATNVPSTGGNHMI